MTILIGHASIDENGKSSGGTAGDQTGKEVCTRSWYSKPWEYMAIHPDAGVRERIAAAIEAACSNDKIGYDQGGRNSLNTQAAKVDYDLSKITTACECDCSSLINVAAIAAGAVDPDSYGSNGWTTSTMKAKMQEAGFKILTSSTYLASSAYCVRGAVYVKAGSHTVCGLDDGASAAKTLAAAGISTETAAAVTTVSETGIALIKKWEGCSLTAYQDVVGVWTIGYGITNSDASITGLTVKKGVTITQEQADTFLRKSLEQKYVPKVTKYDDTYHWNQNQLDALTSFAYNIGSIDQLTANGTRSISTISSKILEYNRAGGKVYTGLTNRRKDEKALFDTAVSESSASSGSSSTSTGSTSSTSSDALTVDGKIGPATVKRLQKIMGTTQDGKISGQSPNCSKYWTAITATACNWNGGASTVVKAWQSYLIGKGYSCGAAGADGQLGRNTALATQKFLIASGYSCGSSGADGVVGTDSGKALQKWLNAQ